MTQQSGIIEGRKSSNAGPAECSNTEFEARVVLHRSGGARQRAELDALKAHLATLSVMEAPELRAEWRRLYRIQPPKLLRRDLLRLGVAWKLQGRALGGLSGATRRQLAELVKMMAAKSDLTKSRTMAPKPGARLLRDWGGATHEVLVVEDGFQWRDRTWPSLSAIAREITGTHWSGPRFFGLTRTTKTPAVATMTKGNDDG